MATKPHDDHAPVNRLYERLTEALQRTRRDPFNVPVTVAEIYQELVPYRLVRAEIGFDMNADYEHTLLRLLSGEGEFVRIEPAHAADEIRRELRGANPNLSIYRDYAACDVWVRKPVTPSEPRRIDITTTSIAAGAPPAQPRAGRAGADPTSPASPQRATPELPSAAPATAVETKGARAPAQSAVASRQSASSRDVTDASTVRSRTEEQQPPEKEKKSPHDFDIVLTDEEADDAADTLTAVGDARAKHREEDQDDERAVAPMSEKSKREPAPAGEGTGSAHGKSTRYVPPPRPPSAPAAPASGARTPPAPPASAKTAPQAAKQEAARCAFCDSQLPPQRQARFCPYCGADQTTRPCPSCGEALEPGWAFCITCGASAQ